MLKYNTIKELVDEALSRGISISQLVLEEQAKEMEKPEEQLVKEMAQQWRVMKEAAEHGVQAQTKSHSGLSGGDAYKLKIAYDNDSVFGGKVIGGIIMRALAVSEVNACMGRIVAAPTAGSCGIIPAVILTAVEDNKLEDEKAVMALFTAGGIGMVIASQAGISGAEGGCQAECGSASAMAAAALVEILGGSPKQVADACAMTIKSILGLVCDPVAGLVEVPCIKRNASGAVNALVAANMAMAGIESVIPVDEVIMAMRSVGKQIPISLKETAEGGLAATPTGRRLSKKVHGNREEK